MAERYPAEGAAANSFGRRHLQEPEARLLYKAEYPAPPDMRVPGAWRLSAAGVPVPPVLEGAARRAEIARIRSSLTEEQQNEPRYAPDSETLWTLYFKRRCEEQITSVNEERMQAISARRAAPSGTGGTRTPPALSLHEPGPRMSGGAG